VYNIAASADQLTKCILLLVYSHIAVAPSKGVGRKISRRGGGQRKKTEK